MAQSALQSAKKAKKDEFYTVSETIEEELKHYKKQFKGKVVFCNCDDPRESNFVKYFSNNFEVLGLKKLIATHYQESTLLTNEPAYKLEYSGDKDGNRIADYSEFITKNLQSDGDFRSKDSIELLKQADIIVTNPPFSLFREYIAQLFKYNKKFLIIGNKNAITYKEVFTLIKENKLWLGYRNINSDMWLEVPEGEKYEKIVDGKRLKHIMACWFTTLDTVKRHQLFDMYKTYIPEQYPKYDNYDAINVNAVAEIPKDYAGAMGVPITFLDKYNPDQFEILGITSGRNEFEAWPTKRYIKPLQHNPNGTVVNGGKINTGAEILCKDMPSGTYYTAENVDGYLLRLYNRVIIKNKRVET